MFRILILITGAVVFVLQLYLCFRCRNPFRYAPMCVLGILEIALWGSFFLIRPGFYTYYIGMLVLFSLGTVVLAWVIWAIVKVIQKR